MKKKIILIQDNKEILDLMDDVLTNDGFDVTPSLTTEPIQNIDSIEADVIIVDDYVKGPKKGSELIAELKSDPETEDMSAILTSTSSDLPQISAACNADDYIEKPFDIDDMINVVRNNS